MFSAKALFDPCLEAYTGNDFYPPPLCQIVNASVYFVFILRRWHPPSMFTQMKLKAQ